MVYWLSLLIPTYNLQVIRDGNSPSNIYSLVSNLLFIPRLLLLHHPPRPPQPATTTTMSSHTHNHTHLNPEATPFLPAITSLPTLPDAALISTLDLLFEPSPDLHALALPTLRTISFSSYDDLISTLRDELLAIADAVALAAADPSVPQIEKESIQRPLHAILGSHPRLGEPKKEKLSAQSRKEQAHLNSQKDSEEVKEELRRLNREYEETFPGLRYVVWVNGRGRGEVMGDMRRRIARGDLRAEEREGIQVGFFLFLSFVVLPFDVVIGVAVALVFLELLQLGFILQDGD